MPLQDTYLQIPLEQIHVDREQRQRRELKVEDLKVSIKLQGVIQPIVVEKNGNAYVLVSGERRFTASKELGLATIPARLASDLSATERRIIELEENVKRQDLPWQDEALAIKSIHDLYKSLDPSWTQARTAEAIGLDHISNQLKVADAILSQDKYVLSAPGMRAAYNILSRRDTRTIADAMDELLHSTPVPIPGPDLALPGAEPVRQQLYADVLKVESILNMDFHKFAATYSSQPFNLIHCDFPYGINHHKSQQGGSVVGTQTIHESYEDSEETYWSLCKTLALHLNTLCAQSAHIFFWLSADIERQIETIRFFAEAAPSLEFQTVPCIWLKSDNRGILPDPNRGPRRIYETALIASRGDRLIIRPVSNAYAAPTTKEIHQSEKPEPVLKHFLSMFVDQNTRLLDPTSGSGSALRAAESLGAAQTLGLEINADFCEAARKALSRSRSLRHAS